MPPQDPVHRDPPPGGPSSPPHHSPTQNSPHQENLPPGENHQTPAKPQTSGHNVTHDTPLDPQATSVGNITLAQALKNYKTQKKAHKTTKSQKKSPPQLDLFHNPEVIVDSFTNQTPFTTLANFVFSFKLHKSPDTELASRSWLILSRMPSKTILNSTPHLTNLNSTMKKSTQHPSTSISMTLGSHWIQTLLLNFKHLST